MPAPIRFPASRRHAAKGTSEPLAPAPAPAASPVSESAPDDRPRPRTGVIYNPRSHRNRGKDLDSTVSPEVYIAKPGEHAQLIEALTAFAGHRIELLVINGGDGTVRDVLTCGAPIFGDRWPAIAVLPKGKTNALSVDIEAPHQWSLQGAIDSYRAGRRIRRAALKITRLDAPAGEPTLPLLGFIMGAGVFTLATRAGQGAHRLGAFDSAAVAASTAWAVLQAMLAGPSNRWRKGAEMDIRLGPSLAPLEHSGIGDSARRQFLFASTLERFPARLKPFGSLVRGLKLAVLDPVHRRTAALLPLVMLGLQLRHARERGIHQLAVNQFEIRLGDEFVLDGEAFPPGHYRVEMGPELEFVAP